MSRQPARRKPKFKRMIAYALCGSHGRPFMFEAGPVAERYPRLLEIYAEPMPGTIKVEIREAEDSRA